MKTILSLIAIALALSGCSTKTPAEFLGGYETSPAIVASQTAEQATVNGCFAWKQMKEQQELAKFDTLTGQNKAMALMHRDTMGMIKNVWGKDDECKPGTNIWDAYTAYVKESETTRRDIISGVKSVATVGIVTTGAVKLTDAIMGRVGDKISTTGDNSSVTKTTSTAINKNDTTATNVGDGQSTANGGSGAKESTAPSGGSETSSPSSYGNGGRGNCRFSHPGSYYGKNIQVYIDGVFKLPVPDGSQRAEGANGLTWKPVSESDGNLVVVGEFDTQFNSCTIKW